MIELTFITLQETTYKKSYTDMGEFFTEISEYGFVTIPTETENILIPREQLSSIRVPVPDEPILP